jgi:multidrug resistance efflux pump
MNEQQEDLKIYSEEVMEILSHPPKSIFLWGNTILIFFFIVLTIFSWVIKYPEFIPAPILVTSQNPPEKILSRTNTKIEKIFIKNGQEVQKNQVLMVLQSSANYEDVLRLKKIVDSISSHQASSFPLSETVSYKLGDLQSDYNAFAKAYQDEKLFSRLKPFAPEDLATGQSISENKSRIAILQQQLNLENAKFDLTKKNYDRSQQLFAQGVIAKMELENEKIKYLQAQQNVKNIVLSISQLEESVNNLHKTKSGVAINAEKDKINYSSQTTQLFEQLRKSLKQWEQSYLLISSTNGSVSFQQFFGENQFVKSGDAILSILPKDKGAVVGRMSVSAINSGKIAKGEKVLIKLDNYRFQEYGIVAGKVENISLTPDDKGNYFVDVILPKGLKTSYNKTLPFDKELKGNAEIITLDLRLIERLFYQIRQLLGHQS